MNEFIKIEDEGFGPNDISFNETMIDLQADWPGMAEAYEKKYNRPWTNWEFREHARVWSAAWKEGWVSLDYALSKNSTRYKWLRHIVITEGTSTDDFDAIIDEKIRQDLLKVIDDMNADDDSKVKL